MPLSVIFVAGLFGILFIGSLVHPMSGILGYMMVYVIHNPNLWWGDRIAEVLSRPSLTAVIFLVIGCMIHHDKLDWNITRREIEFYIFLGVVWLVSMLFSLQLTPLSWLALEKLTKLFVFIFLFLRVVHTLDRFKILLWGIAFGAFFLAYQAHTLGQFSGIRMENIGGLDFQEANALSLFMALGAVILGFELLKVPWWAKILLVIAIALMLDTLVLTRSRAGFFSLVVAFPYVLWAAPRVFRKQIYVFTLLGVVLLFMLTDDYYVNRLDTTERELTIKQDQWQKEPGNPSRLKMWKTSLQVFQDHPMGIGPRIYQEIVPHYNPSNKGLDPHNTYVSCYTELGILGITLFMIIVLESLFQIRRIRRKAIQIENNELYIYATTIGTMLLLYLIGGMMTHTYMYQEIVWILLSLPICLEKATNHLVDQASLQS